MLLESQPPPGGGSTVARTPGEFRCLTESELQNKQDWGFCYRCDEKWGPGHRCKQQELNVLLVRKEEKDEGEEENLEPKPTLETIVAKVNQIVEVSRFSGRLDYTENDETLRNFGKLPMIILIDPRVTHNFISTELITREQLPMTETKAYGLTMGSAKTVQGSRVC